ncbi:MAG: hypothetical protein NXH95_20330 [Pseudomonadaceae bacterium]|nr:hypothetical protein [Pseudomonadaceae bacterium]
MSKALIANDVDPSGFHCPNCNKDLDADERFWTKAALAKGTSDGEVCKPCKRARGWTYKCSTHRGPLEQMALEDLLDLKQKLEDASQPIPAALFTRISKESNKMKRNPEYAAERLRAVDTKRFRRDQ